MSRALDRSGTWIGWAFFADLADALALTFGYMFSRSVTMQYPDKEKWLPYSRYRGHHFLKRDEEGEIKCVACELCARICPCDCIEVVPYEDEKGNRRPAKFEIDMARLYVYKTAWLIDQHGAKGARTEISGIKVAAPAMATRVVDRAIEVFGAAGVSQDTPLAYFYAWARVLRIVDGPDAVHRRTIARQELKRDPAFAG